MYELHNMDCIAFMETLEDKSIDAIITDVPYGTTACKWDVIIPLEPMWEQVKRLCKGVFVTTASQPFTSVLIMSNLEMFKYELIWLKNQSGGFLHAKTQPMKYHENLTVFSQNGHTYNPQFEQYAESTKDRFKKNPLSKAYAVGRNIIQNAVKVDHVIDFERGAYPKSYQFVKSPPVSGDGRLHPSQKPVALYEYLIRTYTNEGDTVLDFCMGSGTTGVACIKTNRNFIGCDNDTEYGYFEIAEKRIHEATKQPSLFQMVGR